MMVSSSRVKCPIKKCCTSERLCTKFAMNENEIRIEYLFDIQRTMHRDIFL